MMSDSSVASQECLEWLIKILEGSQGHLGSSPQKPQTRSRSWSKGDTFPRKALAEEIN